MTLSTESMKSPKGLKTVKIIKNTVANGAKCAEGDVIEMPASIARLLVNIGKAEYYEKPVKKKKATKKK